MKDEDIFKKWMGGFMSKKNSAQYLLDYLKGLEDTIEKHVEITYTKRYIIMRDGHDYTGTDSLSDVVKLINNGVGLYTYRINKDHEQF